MAAVTRRQYKGAAAQTTITNALSTSDTSATLAATTGWPSTASVPFFVVIDPGTANEEKCRATISGSVLTLTRAQDDTTAQTHASGATIYPVFTATEANEANLFASTYTTRGDLLTMNSSVDPTRLALGSANTVLTSNGSDPSWGTVTSAMIADGTIVNGDISSTAAIDATKMANLSVSTKTADYTLVAGDRNTRVVANKATAITFTVNNTVFSAGDVVWVHNIGAGTLTVSAGAGVTLNTAGALTFAQWEGGAVYFTSASAGVVFRGGGTSTLSVDYLVVGGGGGGGYGGSGTAGGGGGAGGFRTATDLIAKGNTYTVTVGAGGNGGSNRNAGRNGTASSFIRSANGGGGSSITNDAGNSGQVGGSGGGSTSSVYSAGTGVSGEGNNGGLGNTTNATGAGGGGGAGSVGSAGTSATGGAGGSASTNSYTGSSISYSGGGGGGGSTTGGTAGTNAGNGAGGSNNVGSNATANRGGGGGGGGGAEGGNGASGRVVLQILTTDLSKFTVTTTGSPTTNHPSATTYTYFAYDATGSFRID